MSRVQAHFVNFTTEQLLDILGKADVPAARVNDISDLREDPHLKAVNFFTRREHPSEGAYWEVKPPVRFVGQAEHEITPAPRLGEHTEDVLRELGLAPAGDE